MKKSVSALVLTLGLILCGCGDSADAKLMEMQNGNTVDLSESTANETSDEDGKNEDNVSEPDSNITEVKVTQGGPYGEITISLPEGWSYEAYPVDSDDLMYGKYGIHFYPEGVNEGYIVLTYYEGFGVCGTGLKEDEITIAGNTSYIGTYDNHDYWDFISFRGKNEGIVALTYCVEEWWNDYGNQVLDILDTLVFDPDVKEGGNNSSSENWMTAEDILAKENNGLIGVHTGVDVRVFVAYNGGFYGAADDDGKKHRYYLPAGDFVFYNEQYKAEAYMVKDEPDLVAVVINGGIQEYQKVFDCTFCIDGVTYGITFESGPAAYSCGDMVQETDDFTVYQAARRQGERLKTEEYVVNVLPILQRTLPNFFNDKGKDYADAWWIALPMVEEFELSVKPSKNPKTVKIINNEEIQDGGDDYALYYYGLDEVNITIDEQTMSLCDALVSKKITLNEIIARANTDVKNGIIDECFFRDGGSQLYQYENYTIVKYHTADGSNRDMYIGTSDMDIHVAEK